MAAQTNEESILHVSVDSGDSSSPQSSAMSSESPGTATSLCFSVPPGDSPRQSVVDDITPKIEESDDVDIDYEETKPLPSPPESTLEPGADVKEEKKKRGRPRKYPRDVGPPKPASKARSKTGCLTCRRRKKKCDEAKPTCNHCEKNNLKCEGYPSKQIWRSGKQRASIARRLSLEQPVALPALFPGMERDELDCRLLDNLAQALRAIPEGHDPWIDILQPMATKHAGLMHSVLCLSATHLIANEPRDQALKSRRDYHNHEAFNCLQKDRDLAAFWEGDASAKVGDATIGQLIVMHLASVADSRPGESYRIFSSTARELWKSGNVSSPEFNKLLSEFIQYHDACSSMTSLSHQPLKIEDLQLPEYMLPPEARNFFGVMHGLFPYISAIKRLRDKMRLRYAEGKNVDPLDWPVAARIDAELDTWASQLEHDNGPRRVASMLYQTVTWLYLYRTMNQRTEQLKQGLERGLRYYRMLSEEGSTLNILLMPLFLLGCSAFWEEQRPVILEEFENLQAFSGLGNIHNAKTVVEEVWGFMDANDPQCWDWEAIMERHSWDFLIT